MRLLAVLGEVRRQFCGGIVTQELVAASRVSRFSRAVEGGAGCQETETGETGDHAPLCARTLGGQGS